MRSDMIDWVNENSKKLQQIHHIHTEKMRKNCSQLAKQHEIRKHTKRRKCDLLPE